MRASLIYKLRMRRNSLLWRRKSLALLVSLVEDLLLSGYRLSSVFLGSYAPSLEEINGVVAYLDVITR